MPSVRCSRSGGIVPRSAQRIFVGNSWCWRCGCGSIAYAHEVGWSKGKYGLIVEAHKRSDRERL